MIAESLNLVNGSPGRTRTADPVINSHLLYQLSYRGILTLELAILPNFLGVGQADRVFCRRSIDFCKLSKLVAKDKRI